jgi:YhcH/YjgK/YiaL family protein
MILDRLEHSRLYAHLGDRIAAALAFLRHPETAAIEPPALGTENSLRIEICGSDVFALVQRYHTKSHDQAFWEAHRKYIDVQCVIEGAEAMGFAPLETMRIAQPYDDAKDFMKLTPRDSDALNFISVSAGSFAIFMPHDAHMPGLAIDGASREVKKIVVKVRV